MVYPVRLQFIETGRAQDSLFRYAPKRRAFVVVVDRYARCTKGLTYGKIRVFGQNERTGVSPAN